jgi:hypothetical protein
MKLPIVCAGHPRDMGLAQGAALAGPIRAAVERCGLATRRSRWPDLRAVVSGPLRGQGAGRELFRHFAHQAERLEGLAQAANLPLDSLLELQLRFGRGALEAEAWIVRESRPVVGFRSLELTHAWLVPAVAGVNERGLALVARPPGARTSPNTNAGREGRAAWRDGDAPPILLVQDCLARFENVAGALDWCRKRPVEGEQMLELFDASGARALVEVRGRERRIEERAEAAAIVSSAPGLRIDPVARRLDVGGIPALSAAGLGTFDFAPLAATETQTE